MQLKAKVFFLFLIAIIVVSLILRIYRLNSIPPALYWDEVSLGYNAYSILKAGIDEHGERFPISRFIAFGDFKPPGYIYASVPSIALFGLSEFSVRFPSLISGILYVVLTYFLVLNLLGNKKIAILSSFVLAVSPWSLQLSRAAFESHLASLFNLFGLFLFLNITKNKGWFLPISVVFFVLSFYTFNANRIVAPLIIILLAGYKIKDLLENKRWVLVSLIIGILLLVPSFTYLKSRESRIRYQEVSIFNNLKILQKSNERIAIHSSNLYSRLIHNRRFSYLQDFLKHYFDHFRFDYLFISGDVNPRLSSQSVGELYLVDLPFVIIGAIISIKIFGKKTLPLFFLLLVGIIPASIAKETPHALRTASVLPAYQIFTAVGLWFSVKRIKKIRFIFIAGTSLIFIFNIFYYLHFYYIHYPRDWNGQWQYGYKEAVKTASEVENSFDYILVTESLGRPYIYFLFYNKIDPVYYIKSREANRDWFGFWYIHGFGKYRFGLNQLPNLNGKILLIGTESETKNYNNILKTIYSPDNKIIFKLVAI